MKSSITVEEFIASLDALAEKTGFQSSTLAEADGQPVRAYQRTGVAELPTIYLSAGIHGDEPAGPLALKQLWQDGLFDQRANWLICPLLNPGGIIRGIRENAGGIDLNRDYLTCQSAEIAGHVDWLQKSPSPDLAISLHEDYETTGFYLYEINCIDCPSDARGILQAVSRVLPPEPLEEIDDHPVREPGWIFHEPEADFPDQWPEAIWLAKKGAAVSYTFETPSSSALDQRIDAQCRATRCLLANFIRRHSPA